MKKEIYITLIAVCAVLIGIGCTQSASIQAMRERLANFRKILPADISEMYDISNAKYRSQYKRWRAEAHDWIVRITKIETNNISNYTRFYSTNEELQHISELTNRFYERINPKSLMKEVRDYSDVIAEKMDYSLQNNGTFQSNLDRIKNDEGINHFSTREVAFYFLWNYVITLERPRRFQ